MNAVYYVSAAVRALMFAAALAVSLLCKRSGIVAPGLLFYYWSAALVCGVFSFASTVLKLQLGSGASTPRVTAVIQFALVAAVWFLTCWADPKPNYIELTGDSANRIIQTLIRVLTDVCSLPLKRTLIP